MVGTAILTVISALMGAIAIRFVESMHARRTSFAALYRQHITNHQKLIGEYERIEDDEWDGIFQKEIRMDTFETARNRTPNLYSNLIQSIPNFSTAIVEMEYLQREMIESRKPDAKMVEDPEEVKDHLEYSLNEIKDSKEGLEDYAESKFHRRLLYSTAIDQRDLYLPDNYAGKIELDSED